MRALEQGADAFSVGHTRLEQERKQMAQQSDDLTMLALHFEDALLDLLLEVLVEGTTSFDQQLKARLARHRFRRHKDFTDKEYEDAVRRAAKRAWGMKWPE
jgi:hypothetical protein